MKRILLFCFALLALTEIHAQNKEKNQDRTDVLAVKYRRSSLYKLMIDDPSRDYAAVIKSSFINGPIQDKFNDHNLSIRTIPATDAKDESANIAAFAETNHIARDVVAKWFNRSAKGGFNVELVKSRGNYDASAIDIAIADNSKRGRDLLADAGEDLIKNTFILVSDFKYISGEKIAQETNRWSGLAGNIASHMGNSAAGSLVSVSTSAANTLSKSYYVVTTAHLFRLDWNDEVAVTFYQDYWADDKTITPQKKKAFDESTIFKLIYIGSDQSSVPVLSTVYTTKTNEQLIERATNKAIDEVIVKLQKNHDEFKTRTPLFSEDPLTAKIGMKEGLQDGTKFEVMEQQADSEGKIKYVKVGTVKVDASPEHPIWDNRYGANDEKTDTNVDRTYFKKVSGKNLYSGMLIVQKK